MLCLHAQDKRSASRNATEASLVKKSLWSVAWTVSANPCSDNMCGHHLVSMCAAATGRMQLKKKTPTRPSIQQLQGSMSAMGLQDHTR